MEEITLNATIVRRTDGGRMWYSNTKLATSNVINLSRSDNKSESFKVSTTLCNGNRVKKADKASAMIHTALLCACERNTLLVILLQFFTPPTWHLTPL